MYLIFGLFRLALQIFLKGLLVSGGLDVYYFRSANHHR